jgi:hypothetical protein
MRLNRNSTTKSNKIGKNTADGNTAPQSRTMISATIVKIITGEISHFKEALKRLDRQIPLEVFHLLGSSAISSIGLLFLEVNVW